VPNVEQNSDSVYAPDVAETVREPKQARSRDSLQRVLQAGAELFEELGHELLTIQHVSRRAEVSVGAIYARFGNKENLVREVHRHAMREVGAMNALLEAGDWCGGLEPAALVHEVVRRESEIFRAHRRLLRASMHLGAVDDVVSSRGSAGSREGARAFRALLVAQLGDRITHPDPELAADVCFRMVYSTLARQVMYGPTFESDRMVEWDELVAELGAACASYLLRS
jgi:AcrR family transcriptional regulator